MADNRKYDLLVSAARTATPADVPAKSPGTSGLMLVIDVTASGGAFDLRPVLKVPGVNPANLAELYRASAGNAVAANGTFIFYFYPMGLEAANAELTNVKDRVSISLPLEYFVSIVHANATSVTYSVRAYSLI